MREILTKDDDSSLLKSVIKKAAAIFLSMTLTVIGSTTIAQAHEAQHEVVIAATPVLSLPSFQRNKAIDILGLPRLEESKLPSHLEMPKLEPQLANLGTEFVEYEDRTPSITGMVTSVYGYRRHPIKGKVKFHEGVDIAAKLGMPVMAPAPGRVIFAGVKNGYGNVVEIDHGNGYTSLLAHHSAILVKVGDLVNSTTVIAKAGRTGWATRSTCAR